ncbi:hypothetical protein [Leptospira yasudae]|uniref:hypothetical protein n=1 Tax=Leptospira yasudae TaxID=2202201 RepID=UPI0010824761|nr:hypothetical protein [Leptospira yasudae]MBW0433002.1 hypothetical protein [Leptospira yasudae]TGK30113.1 hypothetical protein EHQ05_03905 [Leptospira yasudae]TGM04506.1 hypothetical protein EHQ86_14830 [Leptospira yasudae]TGN01031.1 hypothetical protein EHR10_05145 [Leptospira yasudae]
MKKLSFHWKLFAVTFLILGLVNCFETKKEEDNSDLNLLAGLIGGKSFESSNDFVLNGRWNTFTGNATTLDTTITIQAKSGQTGLELTDSSAFGGYSSCFIVIEFNNEQGYYITQNPENNGGCFAGDTNKGKYNKIFFFKNTAKDNSYWSCTVGFGIATLSAARSQADTSVKTNPGTTGCGANPFNRLEKR